MRTERLVADGRTTVLCRSIPGVVHGRCILSEPHQPALKDASSATPRGGAPYCWSFCAALR